MSTKAEPYYNQFDLLQVAKVVWAPLFVAFAYWVGAEAAFFFGTLSDKIFAPLWPPNIVMLCAFLLTPPRKWLIFIVTIFPVHALVEAGHGMGLQQLIVAFSTNCFIAVAGAASMLALIRGPPWFDGFSKTAKYIFFVGFLCPALTAFGGAFVRVIDNGSLQHFREFWIQWFLSNALGALALGPVSINALTEYRSILGALTFRKASEIIVTTAALIFVCIFAFGFSVRWIGNPFFPALLYSPLPLIIWAAARFGVKGASGAILVVAAIVIWYASNGVMVFEVQYPDMNVSAIQVFLIGLAVPILLLGASSDETRRANRRVRDSEERIAFAAASVNMCMWRIDHPTNEFWLSDYGRTLFGFDKAQTVTWDMLGKSIQSDDRAPALYFLESTHSESGTGTDLEFRIVRPASDTRWVRARAYTHLDSKGKLSHTSGTFTDITHEKTTEAETIQKGEEIAHLMRISMLGELSAGIAHELSQPLTAILSNAEAARSLMEDGAPDFNEITAILDDIIVDDHRAGDVIQRFRSLLKKNEPKFELVNVNDLVRSTLHLIRSELIARRVNVNPRLSNYLPAVHADSVQIQQVILNLVMNSIDAMEGVPLSRRILSITTRAATGGIWINIADRGTGLNAEYRDKMFKPFFTTKANGLGLGLSICEAIITLHGGALTLENRRSGGAVAAFSLPILGARRGTLA